MTTTQTTQEQSTTQQQQQTTTGTKQTKIGETDLHYLNADNDMFDFSICCFASLFDQASNFLVCIYLIISFCFVLLLIIHLIFVVSAFHL